MSIATVTDTGIASANSYELYIGKVSSTTEFQNSSAVTTFSPPTSDASATGAFIVSTGTSGASQWVTPAWFRAARTSSSQTISASGTTATFDDTSGSGEITYSSGVITIPAGRYFLLTASFFIEQIDTFFRARFEDNDTGNELQDGVSMAINSISGGAGFSDNCMISQIYGGNASDTDIRMRVTNIGDSCRIKIGSVLTITEI